MCCISFSWVSENWILCTLSQNHNIHWGKWCLSAIDNVCIEVKKFVGKEMHFPLIWRSIFQKLSPWCPNNSANSKETQSFGKNRSREKCLDKSLLIEGSNQQRLKIICWDRHELQSLQVLLDRLFNFHGLTIPDYCCENCNKLWI